jgi:hypothetical protein
MKKRLHRLRPPSPAMTVACVALLVALAGTSVAAVSVLPRNSVGALQLKANSVNSSKVLNGSLLRADFRAGQVPAGPAGPPGAPGATGATGPAGAAGIASPGYVAEVLSQSGNADVATTSTTYTNLNGGSLTVTVPSGETDKLVAFFSGESVCYGAPTPPVLEQCLLKINVDGTEMSPAGGSDAFFDNNDLGVKGSSPTIFNPKSSGDRYQHAIVRVSGNLSAGSHTVQVQYSVTNSSTAFNLDDWTLVVQRIKVS